MYKIILNLFISTQLLLAQLPKVAIMEMTSKSVKESDVLAINNKLSEELYKSGYFDIIERSNMSEICKEIGLQQSGLIDEADAIKAGKIAGVKKLFIGTVEIMEDIYMVAI